MRSLLFSSQQVAERRPLFFVCPSFTAGAPREFSQRDPRDVLLPGGGDISQPCITDQLSLRSPSLYEESLLQHRDHVSKRNKFVGPIHRQGDMNIHDVKGWIWTCGTCRTLITRIYGYANALCENFESELWDGLYEGNIKKASRQRWKRTTCPPEQGRYGSKDLRYGNCASPTWTLPLVEKP